MGEAPSIGWRSIASALAAFAFGLGAFVLGVLVFPSLRLVYPDGERRHRACKEVLRRAYSVFVATMRRLGVLTVEMHGAEKLQRTGLLVLANHPTLIDALLLMSVTPRADCLVKASLLTSWLTGPSIRAAGYQSNGAPLRLIADCLASVRQGNNLIIFPEGTRTPASGEYRLLRGAAVVALRGGFAITPVRIRCEPPTLQKGDRWYRMPRRRPHFRIDVGDDMHFEPAGEKEARATRRFNAELADFFRAPSAPVEDTHA